MNLLLRAGALMLGGALAAGCVVSVDSQGQIVREEKRFTVDGIADLHLSTFDGAIRIDGWDRPDVLVEIEKRGPTREAVEALVVDATQRGRLIEIQIRRPANAGLQGLILQENSSAQLIVSVPQRTDIVARSGDGSIETNGVQGRLELRTGDGAIRAARVDGELILLDTGDGSVTVDGAEGRLKAETGDGGVNVRGKLSAVRMHTGDGSIVYRAETGASMSDDWDISTGDGSVALYLPSAFNAELDAHTGDGTIRADLDVVAVDPEQDRESRRHTVRGRLGEGGHKLRIRTGDGSITLKSR
jgi:hypothetical protein